MIKTPLDKSIGSFVGLAVGDALGAPLEFSRREDWAKGFIPVTDYLEGGPFNLKAGQWTDDTSQAICLAEAALSLGSSGNLPAPKDLQLDFLDRMVKWYRLGHNSSTGECFDIGYGTRVSLERYQKTRIISPNPDGLGNGCIMRLAPIPIAFHRKSNHLLSELAGASCDVTHSHKEAIICTNFLARLISGLIKEGDPSLRDNVLSQCLFSDVLPADSLTFAEIDSVLEDLNDIAYGEEISTIDRTYYNPSGHVIKTLGTALYCAFSTDSFEECLVKAVNFCGDSDSVGAVAGQLAGAIYGFSAIPKQWVSGLYDHDRLIEMATSLHNLYA